MRRKTLLFSLLISTLTVAACGPGPLLELAELDAPVAWGKPDKGHPEVGDLGGCSSTLIGRSTVLTAAHCVPSKTRTYTFKTLGSTYYSSSVTVHADYNGDISDDADLAVVHLRSKVLGVKPAQLVPDALKAKEKIVMVGFGLTDTDQINGGEKYVGENIIDKLSSMTFSILNEKGAGTCPGDSGGPSFVFRNGKERQAGIHSRGTFPPCGSLFGSAIDVRVDAFRAWIEKQAGADLYKGEVIDTESPKLTISNPADGAKVPRDLTVKATATDNVGVTSAEVWLNGTLQETVSGPGPYAFSLPGLYNTSHTIKVVVWDIEKNSDSATVKVTALPGTGFGIACTADAECQSRRCLAGVVPMCTQACSASKPCPNGFTCGADGFCTVAAESGCSVSPARPLAPVSLFALLAFAIALGIRRRND
jgi:MYXO-CTERM domain-containing protein